MVIFIVYPHSDFKHTLFVIIVHIKGGNFQMHTESKLK